VCDIYIYIYGTLREYVYFVGRLKGSIYLVNERLDFRNAANSLRIEGPRVLPGDPYHGWVGTRNQTICIIIYI